jgi:hypothetical protein
VNSLPFRSDARAAVVVPLFGRDDRVPSPVLVRAAVGRLDGAERDAVRAAEGVAAALGELVRREARGRWEQAVAAAESELMLRSGLSHAEVTAGLALLEAAGVAARGGAGVHLDPAVVGELPCLARLDWEQVRTVLHRQATRLAPALAVLREVARTSTLAGTEPEWTETALPALTATLGYGRTVVSQALSALETGALIERAATRRLRLRIAAGALGTPRTAQPETGAAAPGASAAAPETMLGGHPLRLPPGTPIELRHRADGGSELAMGPLTAEMDADGAVTLAFGALRIRL